MSTDALVSDQVLVACSVVGNGWPVLAIRTGTKQPSHARSDPDVRNHREFWLESETAVVTEYETAADAWSGRAGCQFAVMTGQQLGDGPVLGLFDVDGGWAAFDALVSRAGSEARAWADATVRSQRVSNRAHVIGLVPARACPLSCVLARSPDDRPSLEWRGTTGYVLLPGALHPAGQRYRITAGPAPDHDPALGIYVGLDESGAATYVHPLPVPSSLLALLGGGPDRSAGEPAVSAGAAFDRVVAALRAAGRSPVLTGLGAVRARCPAHDDQNPSLDVKDSGDGRALLICRAHCATADVVAALGLTMADLFDGSQGVEIEVQDTVIDLPELTDATGRPVRVTITAAEVRDQVKKDTLRDVSRDLRARAAARPFASQFYGVTGEDFDPDRPEPRPCELRYALDPDAPLDLARGSFVFPPGFHILFGPKAVMKTWICVQAVIQTVRRGGTALFIDYEDTKDDFFRRMHVLGASSAEMSRVVYLRPPGPLSDDGREFMVARFRDLGADPSLIVLDSIGQGVAAYGLDDNASGGNGVGTFIEDIPMWLKHQWPTAVIVGIDHLPKGVPPETATDPLGSGRKGFAADGLWSVHALSGKPTRNTHGSVRLTCRKDRRGYFEEGQMVLDASFGGGKPLVLAPADPKVATFDLTHQKDTDFTVEQLPDVVRVARWVVAHPGSTVEDGRLDLGFRAADYTALHQKMVVNEVLVHPSRKGLAPGPGLRQFLAFARLFGIEGAQSED